MDAPCFQGGNEDKGGMAQSLEPLSFNGVIAPLCGVWGPV